jgi:hypothetical protein
MKLLDALFAAPLALALACGGSATEGSAALDAAMPNAAALTLDQVASDSTAQALTLDAAASQAAAASAVIAGDACHPHLFIRQREVVERVNRHIRKALHHVEEVIAKNPITSTDTTKVWERVVNGVERRFTITRTAADVYTWELDAGAVGTTPLPVVMTGQIDRSGATAPHQGKGAFHVDFANLFAAYPSEKVSQGTLDVQFDVESASRKLTVTAADVAWDLDPAKFSGPIPSALSAPRSGSYVYDREPGKGGSLEIQDQMVFACPSNLSLLAADAQLVSRWYRTSDGTVHGRSDASMVGGQLSAAGIARVVAVTCHESAAEAQLQAEGFWLMKAEDAGGATLSGASSATGASPCDPVFGDVPLLSAATNDFNDWPASFSDGIPFPFPGM